MPRPEDKTVLVVDDEPDVRAYLASILSDAGFKVLTAQDGEEALEIAREKRPDFISLDLIMPRKSGQKFLYEIRKDRNLSNIPVLIVTAHAQDELGKPDLQNVLSSRVLSGPGTYLEKPVDPLSYVRSVKRALGIEVSGEEEDRLKLRQALESELKIASPDVLRRVLKVLKTED